MKKAILRKKGIAFTIAAMMVVTANMPAAAFASEGTDEQAPVETSQETSEPESAPAPAPAPAPETSAPAASTPAPAAPSTFAPAQESSAPSTSAPATETSAPAQEKATETNAPAAVQKAAPAQAGSEQADSEAQNTQEAEEESPYGQATGNWGYGNGSQNTRWDEYTKDGETILVFRVIGDSELDEDKAITELLDENGISVKEELKGRVTKVIFETGVTGIGWTALYDKNNGMPHYAEGYVVDRNKTDLFKGFTKLTTVVPCETIKRIGWSAFRKCSNLTSFDFSVCTQLEEIMNQAFNECSKLNNIDLSNCNLLQNLAYSAFNGAGKGANASLALPTAGSLAVIGGYAFYGYAGKNAEGTSVDFSGIAGTVTQILQKAFEGAHIAGTIANFKNLEKVGNDAFKNSYIVYIPYEPGQDEENNEPAPADNNDPAPADNNDPAPADNNDPAPADDNNDPAPAENNDPAPVDNNDPAPADDNNDDESVSADSDVKALPTIESDDSEAAPGMMTAAAAETAVPSKAAAKAAANAGVHTMMTAISDSAYPLTAGSALTAAGNDSGSIEASTISDTDVPMATLPDEASFGYIIAAALGIAALMVLSAAVMMRRRSDDEEK